MLYFVMNLIFLLLIIIYVSHTDSNINWSS